MNKIEIPPAEIDADLALPAFNLNKNELVEKIKSLNSPFIKELLVAGQYVNIKLNLEKVAPDILGKIFQEKDGYGFNQDGQNKDIFIEYSSPNIAKPMHIGHLRNTVLGHALKNIYEANGYKVTSANYIGDWGMQFGKILLAYQKWGDKNEFAKNPVPYLMELYVRVTKEIETNPKLEEEARAIFKKLESGDKELAKLWEKFKEVSIADFKKIYQTLGIDFDLWQGEAFYQKFVPEIIREALDKKVATQESGGPVVVNLGNHQPPSFLLQKSDGASLYGARDLATAKWRLENYNPEKIIYVAGHEQELYFKQIFKTLGSMGYPEEKFLHISYGVVKMNGKKLSTRAGEVIFAEDILEEAIKKAKDNEIVGVGAVVYNFLSQGKEKDVDFDWKRMLNLQGNTAPYIQYGYVRAFSILEKVNIQSANRRTISNIQVKNINHDEAKLIKLLAFYPETVRQAKELNAPHIIANYLNSFVQEFNRFYAENPVLTAENEETKTKRLALTKASAQVIKNGLWLLGIRAPEKM